MVHNRKLNILSDVLEGFREHEQKFYYHSYVLHGVYVEQVITRTITVGFGPNNLLSF